MTSLKKKKEKEMKTTNKKERFKNERHGEI